MEFEGVSFAYLPGEWVLRDISFRVEPGERVAFVGATGAGKTSLIKLLTRLYEVNEGRILLDGVDLRETLTELAPSPHSCRASVGEPGACV